MWVSSKRNGEQAKSRFWRALSRIPVPTRIAGYGELASVLARELDDHAPHPTPPSPGTVPVARRIPTWQNALGHPRDRRGRMFPSTLKA